MRNSILLLLAGFAAGILLAPRKGSETWEMILDKVDEMKGYAEGEAEDVAEKADDLGESIKRKAGNMASDVKNDYSSQF